MSEILAGGHVFDDHHAESTRRLGVKVLEDSFSVEICIEDDQEILGCVGIDSKHIGKLIRALQGIKEELDDRRITRLCTGDK